MGIAGAGLVASAIVLQLICQSYGQLADNLIVSGSDKPMAYGVGTYGLKGAGSQGISGQSQGGGLYSQKIPTFTLSKRVPGVIVSDGSGHAHVYSNSLDALGAMAGIIGNNVGDQIKEHNQQAHALPRNSFAAVQAPQQAAQPAGNTVYPAQPADSSAYQAQTSDSPDVSAQSAGASGTSAQPASEPMASSAQEVAVSGLNAQPAAGPAYTGQPGAAAADAEMSAQAADTSAESVQPASAAPSAAQGDVSTVLGRKLMQQAGGAGMAAGLASMGAQTLGALGSKLASGVADLAQGRGPTITQGADGTLQVLTNNNSGDEVQFQRDGTLTYVNGGNAPSIFSVGPKGVHLEKDNIFNSQAYAAGAPAITIGNEPSTSGGSSSSSSSSSSSQPAYSGASQTAPSGGSQNSQTTQNAYGSTSQAPTTSGYSTGNAAGTPASVNSNSNGSGGSNTASSSYGSDVPAPAPTQSTANKVVSSDSRYATAPTSSAAQGAGVETCCGPATASPVAASPQAIRSMEEAAYLQAQQPAAQHAEGPAVAAESFVTQALGQLRAQEGQPVLGRRL